MFELNIVIIAVKLAVGDSRNFSIGRSGRRGNVGRDIALPLVGANAKVVLGGADLGIAGVIPINIDIGSKCSCSAVGLKISADSIRVGINRNVLSRPLIGVIVGAPSK